LNVGAGLRTAIMVLEEVPVAVRRPAPTFLLFSRFVLSGNQKLPERLSYIQPHSSNIQPLDSESEANRLITKRSS
jgi:hypothetical protein